MEYDFDIHIAQLFHAIESLYNYCSTILNNSINRTPSLVIVLPFSCNMDTLEYIIIVPRHLLLYPLFWCNMATSEYMIIVARHWLFFPVFGTLQAYIEHK